MVGRLPWGQSNDIFEGPKWVIRDWGEPTPSPVTSAVPPKAEVNSER